MSLAVVFSKGVFEGFRYACCAHVVPVRWNTYAAVAALDSPTAATAIVSPETLTASPNTAFARVLEALT